MTPEAQRIAIAEACGWMQIHNANTMAAGGIWFGYPPVSSIIGKPLPLPDYLNDLNACFEMEETLTYDQAVDFCGWISMLTGQGKPFKPASIQGAICHATAAQRAEAFLRALNLWRDS